MKFKITRDLVVATAATALLVYEITFGGGRPAALTACVSLLLSPLIMRVDEARKEKNGGKHRERRASGAEGNADAP